MGHDPGLWDGRASFLFPTHSRCFQCDAAAQPGPEETGGGRIGPSWPPGPQLVHRQTFLSSSTPCWAFGMHRSTLDSPARGGKPPRAGVRLGWGLRPGATPTVRRAMPIPPTLPPRQQACREPPTGHRCPRWRPRAPHLFSLFLVFTQIPFLVHILCPCLLPSFLLANSEPQGGTVLGPADAPWIRRAKVLPHGARSAQSHLGQQEELWGDQQSNSAVWGGVHRPSGPPLIFPKRDCPLETPPALVPALSSVSPDLTAPRTVRAEPCSVYPSGLAYLLSLVAVRLAVAAGAGLPSLS